MHIIHAVVVALLLGALIAASDARIAASNIQDSRPSFKSSIVATSLPSRSTKATLGIVVITDSSGMTEEDFTADACAQMASQGPITGVSLNGLVNTNGEPIFHYPSCLHGLTNTVRSIVLNNLILNGSTTSDAMRLLGPTFDQTMDFSMYLTNVIFHDHDEAIATINWPSAFSYMPYLNEFSLASCQLQGSLPTPFPPSTRHITIDRTPFTGTIPASFLPDGWTTLTAVVNDTLVNGDLPNLYANAGVGAAGSIIFNFNSRLTGTIASNFFSGANSSTISAPYIDISNNPLSGTVSSTLWGLPTNNALYSLNLIAANTNFSSLPTTFLAGYNCPELTFLLVDFSASGLKGNFPNSIMPAYAPQLEGYDFIVDINPLGGTIPTSFFSSIALFIGSTRITKMNVKASGCGLTGILMFPSQPQNLPNLAATLTFEAPGNSFSVAYSQPNSTYLDSVTISNPTTPTRGRLDNFFWTSSSTQSLISLDLGGNTFSGTMPDLNLLNDNRLTILVLSGTAIDFCSDLSRSPWIPSSGSFNYCSLDNTNANQCPTLYPNCSATTSAPRGGAPSTPSPAPITTCPNSTRPGPDFVCFQGVWVFLTTFTTPTLNIPSSGTTNPTTLNEVFILGNLTSNTVAFKSLGSKLSVAGCANSLKTITVDLSDEELDLISNSATPYKQELLSAQGGSCTNLSTLSIKATSNSRSCTKVVAKTETEGGQLYGLFSISTSNGCAKKTRVWVIVVPIVCGVVLLGVIITVLVVTFCKGAKDAVRPYAGSDPHAI